MQVILERVLFAVVGAIAIIIVLAILGVSIAYREEIVKRNIDTYARIIVVPASLVATIYFYIQGLLGPDILFIAIVWLVPILLCMDWPKLWRTQKADNLQETSNEE